MENTGINEGPATFPFKSTLTFSNIIGYWQLKAADKSSPGREVARTILQQLEMAPELFNPIEDLETIHRNLPLVETILSAVFPFALLDDELAVAMKPYHFQPIYATRKFSSLFMKDNTLLFPENADSEELLSKKTLQAYVSILEQFYGIVLPLDRPMIFNHLDKNTQLERFYKVTLNQKFCEIKVHGQLPVLTEEMIRELKDNALDIELWTKYLPPQHFEFQGVALLQLIDVTEQEILSSLKYDLLEKDSIIDTGRFESLQQKVRILFGIPDLKLGLAAFQKNRRHYVNFGKKICHSIIMRNSEGLDCSCSANAVFQKFQKKRQPLILNDLSTHDPFEGYGKIIFEETGVKNLLVAPLYNNEEFIGILELGTPKAGALNALTLFKLNQIIALFAIAIKRNSEELENQIRTIIRTKYTAIHPAVEWKFVNSALNFIDKQMKGLNGEEIEPVIFDQVYPLYGASDIRSSSYERNKAIREDLIEHLLLASQTLLKVYNIMPLPLIEQTLYRIDKHKAKISEELISGDEATIIEFIHLEVEPLLQQLAESNATIEKAYSAYKEKLDPKLHIYYNKRKAFEESLNTINSLIASYLDNEEKGLQAMYPHYFEKYKTDGVEYNIYIGDSITGDRPFDQIYVRNLRLWQIISMAEIATKTASLMPRLKIPLETTQLILVQSTPLSIRFRMDEKRFDVDGAYNVRYEIIKKRIDKALIKGTEERLTRPGSIVIVYSQEKEAVEYKGYIEYLQNKHILLPNLEELELQDLQDVQGLKALRVDVNLENAEDLLIQNLLNETSLAIKN